MLQNLVLAALVLASLVGLYRWCLDFKTPVPCHFNNPGCNNAECEDCLRSDAW
ncbi:hypothetical protein EDF59_113152 [Novosphingobium sp. ST904]|nr:hypothetical protein EDF59_113152 [Novosphingobium sp. ST904]